MVIFGALAWLLLLFMATLLAVGSVQKLMLTLLVGLAAASAFEVDRLGIVIDRQMVQSMAIAATTEAGHLLTTDFLGYFFLHATPGLLLIFWPQVRRHKPVPAGLRDAVVR